MSGEGPTQGDGIPRPPQTVNYAQFVRPEHIKNLPHFDDAQKVKYEEALRRMWAILDSHKHDQTSQDFRNAVNSLTSASQRIRAHIRNMNQQQESGGMPRPASQAGPSAQVPAQTQPAMNNQQQAPQHPQQTTQPGQSGGLPAPILQKINSLQWATPAGTVAGTAEAQNKTNQVKQQYGQAMLRELQAQDQIQKLTPIIRGFSTKNADPPTEVRQKYAQWRTMMQQAQEVKKRIEAEQQELMRQAAGQTQNTNISQQPSQSQQPAQPPQASPTLPPTTQAGNTNNAQNRNNAPAQQTPTTQQPPTGFSQQPQPTQPAAQPPRPAPFSIQQPGNNNSPQTQGQIGSTQSLSHQGALAASQAARTHHPGSNPPSATAIPPAGSNPPSSYGNGPVRSESSMNANPKMPIPKHLNTTAPTPVTMGPGRPTLAGVGSGPGVQGVMGQPVMQKPPGYTLEGEGEHVLSRKKLDELVRQVTGAEGPGAGLSQECEEAMLSIADEFIDDVITAACRLAKLRDGATLDIRDIQIILERNYNIRIPGYALDEVRTVKKFHPAPGWTQKMNSIQAAKVMGGKNDA